MKKLILCSLFMSVYPVYAQTHDTNTCVPHVQEAFAKIPRSGKWFGVKVDGKIPALSYSRNLFNRFGYQNHFQGVQRIFPQGKASEYLVVSGGDQLRKKAHLFILQLASKKGQRELGGNTQKAHWPIKYRIPSEDKVIRTVDITQGKFWHAGGMSLSGDLLAVPLEDFMQDHTSVILFYDVSNPEQPKFLKESTLSRLKDKNQQFDMSAGSVALHTLKDGRLLFLRSGDGMDIYYSPLHDADESINFSHQPYIHWEEKNLHFAQNVQSHEFGGSSMSLMEECKTHQLYLSFVDNLNHCKIGPHFCPGTNVVDLYKVDFPKHAGLTDFRSQPAIEKVASNVLAKGEYNFGAAGNLFVDPDGVLGVYGTQYFKTFHSFRYVIKGEEFYPSLEHSLKG